MALEDCIAHQKVIYELPISIMSISIVFNKKKSDLNG